MYMFKMVNRQLKKTAIEQVERVCTTFSLSFQLSMRPLTTKAVTRTVCVCDRNIQPGLMFHISAFVTDVTFLITIRMYIIL